MYHLQLKGKNEGEKDGELEDFCNRSQNANRRFLTETERWAEKRHFEQKQADLLNTKRFTQEYGNIKSQQSEPNKPCKGADMKDYKINMSLTKNKSKNKIKRSQRGRD